MILSRGNSQSVSQACEDSFTEPGYAAEEEKDTSRPLLNPCSYLIPGTTSYGQLSNIYGTTLRMPSAGIHGSVAKDEDH